MWYLIAFFVYVIYSICITSLFAYYNVPTNYNGWIEVFPNKTKRLLLFIFSGFIAHIVIGGSYIISRTGKNLNFIYEWLKAE